jgi:hypothetical protein
MVLVWIRVMKCGRIFAVSHLDEESYEFRNG